MLFYAVMALYGLLYAFVLTRTITQAATDLGAYVGSRRRWAVPAVFVGAFAIRLICAPLVKGHPIDFNDFTAWAIHAYSVGFAHFYDGIFADYPPGYVYVLYLLGFLRHSLGLDIHAAPFIVLLKLPAITADLICGWVIYRLAHRRIGYKPAIILSSLYVVNPVVFLNSVLWAQVDSVFILVIMLMVLALTEKKLTLAAVLFAAALLIKPQSLVYTPLLLFALVQRNDWRVFLRSIVYGASSFVVLLIPFIVGRDPLWIVEKYRVMFSIYPYASLNAFNGYALIGANGAHMSGSWLRISFQIWDAAALLAILVLSLYLFARNKEAAKIPYIALLLTLLVFLLKTGMHERYGYAAPALAILSYIYWKDRRILYILLGASLTHFANTAYVLGESFHRQYFINPGDPVMAAVSAANVLITAYAVYLGFTLLVKPNLLYNGKDQPGMEGQTFGTALLQIRHDEQR